MAAMDIDDTSCDAVDLIGDLVITRDPVELMKLNDDCLREVLQCFPSHDLNAIYCRSNKQNSMNNIVHEFPIFKSQLDIHKSCQTNILFKKKKTNRQVNVIFIAK